MPTIPNLEFREALTFGSAALRGLVDASAGGSYLKPWFTPGIVDHNGLFEFNAGHQNNGGRSSYPSAAAARAALTLKLTQPGGTPTVDDSPGGASYELPLPTADHADLTDTDYGKAGSDMGVSDVMTVKAVAEVESGGRAFLADGRPVVRFEPHHFRQLTFGRFDKGFPALSAPYSVVKKQHLSKGDAAGYLALEQAIKLDADAAVQACSWGAFQVMGNCWKTAKFSSPHAMLLQVYQRSAAHLQLFAGYIQQNNLASALETRDWATFARRYNGSDYATGRYDEKLKECYDRLANGAKDAKASENAKAKDAKAKDTKANSAKAR